MRLISFALTKEQIRAHTKTVTRRMGWEYLQPGEKIQGCEKVMGRRKGEPLVKLAVVQVISVTREPLRRLIDEPEYGAAELAKEGFPGHDREEWVAWFCQSHKGCTPETLVTRIEFDYADIGFAVALPDTQGRHCYPTRTAAEAAIIEAHKLTPFRPRTMRVVPYPVNDEMRDVKTQSTGSARSVPLHRSVRLVAPLAGQYCKLEAGEIVMIVPMYEERGETIWRVARKAWTNSLTISNVLAGVPDHKLIVEELND